ncbi:MAG: HAD family hydrolase [Gemmatimonadota bacterium]
MRRAVFLDRDGTLIEDPGYINDPERVRLLPDVGAALARLHRAGFLLLVVTNQSGIARGLITPEQYQSVADRLQELTATAGGPLDRQYFCPHLPELSGPCECRKPGVLLFERAIREWQLEPAACWWVGDRLRDVVPGLQLGGQAILAVANPDPEVRREAGHLGIAIVDDLSAATDRLLMGQR